MKDNSTQSYPKVSSVKFDADPNEYEFSSGEKYDEYSQIITIEKPPTEFEYVTILVTSELADIVHEDSYNDFGELVPGYTEKGKTFEDTIVIDKKTWQISILKHSPDIWKIARWTMILRSLYRKPQFKMPLYRLR